jgi:single-stranded DNA-specific DHH superfamily exonuclease
MYVPRGVDKACGILAKSTSFLDYYDPDIDGAISGDLIRRFLQAFRKPYQYYINDNRTHGFRMTDAQIDHLKGITLILVDAGMTRQEVIRLTSAGVNVINIDHHHLNEDELVYVKDDITGCEGVIINNQYPFEPEEYRFLSGAGVVYYVLNAISPGFCAGDEKALVGLSLLSDIRPIESPIAQDFLHTTYTHKSPLMEYLIHVAKNDSDFGFGVQTFDRNFIDYTFSPKVNALFRLNKGYDAIALFEGKFDYGSGLAVYRKIQNALADTIIENLQGHELSNLVFKYVPSNIPMPYTYEVTNFIGLACSKVKNFGKTSMLFVKEGDSIKRGSVRGLCDDVDYLDVFRKHGFRAEGHKNAFGVISVDFAKVDLEAMNAEIARLEHGYEERKYEGRIFEVNNLAFFLKSKNQQFADHNNYVRDPHRVFLRYTGSNVERYQKGRAVEFTVDGIKVMSFDQDLSLENALVLPVRERGNYVQFYLKRY